jgi:NAD(P)-dependent dehydrogenase (short-subunit alcohol dehydrogenase family)
MTGFNSVFRSDLFKDQFILVTGGGTGIGRCIAHELASLGATVIIAGRRPEPLAETVEEIQSIGGKADSIIMNIRDEEQVDEVLKELVAKYGRLDALVNNAGGQFASPAAAIKPKGWRAVIDTNLNGTWFVSQAAYKHSMSRKGGAIVTIVADMWNGFPTMAHTGAARAGVVNLTQSLAIEWASSGVRINAVAPGFILSSGMKTYPSMVQKMAAAKFRKNPSARAGTESEVSAAVSFLLSPAAAYITGETLRVDGASSLQKETLFPMIEHNKLPPWTGFHLKADLPEILRGIDGSND